MAIPIKQRFMKKKNVKKNVVRSSVSSSNPAKINPAKASRMKYFFRTLNKGAKVAAVVGLLGASTAVGVKESARINAAGKYKKQVVAEHLVTSSGKKAAEIYTKQLRSRNPAFQNEYKKRVSTIGALEKKLVDFNKTNQTSLTVSRIMHTVEKHSVLGDSYKFTQGQIKYAKNPNIANALKLVNSLPIEQRKTLIELARTPNTYSGIASQARKDGYRSQRH